MVRPLKDIVAELEAKYPKPLLYDLQERSRIIEDFESDMKDMLGWIERYEKNIKFVLERKLDLNIILRMTTNLAIVMHHFCKSLYDYDYAIGMYLMDDRYEKNHDLWLAFTEVKQKLQILLDRMLELDVFEYNEVDENEVSRRVFCEEAVSEDDVITIDHEVLSFQREEVEKLNGAELVVCIKRLLSYFDDKFYELKNSGIQWWTGGLNDLYERNYLLYAKKYWPKHEERFRQHISKQRLRNNVTLNGIEKLRDELIHDFEYNTTTGKIWRDYSEDIPQMALQMREQKLNDEQWNYFFQNIFEIEELDRWIEELRNPPESEEDRQKRARLLRSNKIFNLQPANQKKGIDILLLYQFIDTRFISEITTNYEWYALYYVFKKNGILKVRLAEDFAKQMNHEEWFPNVDMRCIVKAIKDYGFLEEAEPGQWVVNIRKTTGAKTSKKSFDTILQRYEYLTDCLDEIFAEETSMVKEGYTIINYGTYNDVHDNKTVKL